MPKSITTTVFGKTTAGKWKQTWTILLHRAEKRAVVEIKRIHDAIGLFKNLTDFQPVGVELWK